MKKTTIMKTFSKKTLWKIYTIIKFCSDLLFSLISFFLAYHIRFYNKLFTTFVPPVKGIPPIDIYYKFIPFFILICCVSYSYAGHYKQQLLKDFDEIVLNVKSSLLLLVLLFATSFFYRGYEYSRMFMAILVCINFLFISCSHIFLNHFYKKYIKYIFGKPRIGFICTPDKKSKIVSMFKNNKTIKRFFLTFEDENVDTLKSKIENFVKERKISELVVTYEVFSNKTFQELLPEVLSLEIPVKIILSLPVKLSDVLIDSTLGIPTVWVRPLSLTSTNFFIKRSIDICVSILVLGICFIPLLFISLLILLDDPKAPIFFIHKRVGYNGKVFKCVKFRTMVKDAHKMWWDLLKYSERGDKVFKLKNDPRVTPIGKWLRKFSIDEIPQFFNILKGDMSIVGPRPQIVEEASFYDMYAKRRLMILPGLTGLWQISGRADTSFEEMINLDLYYIENWSMGLDLEIILKTIFVLFSQKGAY